MILTRCSWAAKCCCFLSVLLLTVGSPQLLSSAHHHEQQQQQEAGSKPSSYIDAYGQHSTLAARLAELVEAEEPLQPEDVARLAAAVK